MKSLQKIIQRVWTTFISLRLTFVLLGFIGVGAIIGMSFDQTLTFDQFLEKHPRDTAYGMVFSVFELYDAFHSWWFCLAVFLLALNLIACSIERLPRIFFEYIRPRPYLTDRRLMGLTHKYEMSFTTKADCENVVANFLKKPLEKTRLPQHAGFFFVDQHAFGRFGVYIVHIALLIIMFSSIYATQNGVDGHVLVEEGKMARFVTARGASGVTYNYDLGFYIGCDDFRLRTFVDNSPMEFESDLFISEQRDDKIIKKTVRVNEPLNYAGFTFYQSSYQPIASEPVVEVEIGDREGLSSRHRVRLHTPITVNDSKFVVEKIYDDFAGLGQALRIAKTRGDEAIYFHIFRRYPDFDRTVRDDDYHVKFLESDQHYATGLSVSKMPGISIIFGGFALLMFGLYCCFFTTPMRFFARITDENGEHHVVLAAAGFRHPQAVKDIFSQRLAQARLKNEMHHA